MNRFISQITADEMKNAYETELKKLDTLQAEHDQNNGKFV